ncbi:MAG: HAD hydrolase-like protein, partial [Candidatus Electryoneaceae bacterium]|nr:HAD hydrolase-like protein [Candidatus Electryoneaceae bacterium]
MIKAIIFDLDNTLVDFLKMKWESVKAAVNAMVDAGLDMKSEDALDAIKEIYNEKGIEYPDVFDQFLTQHYGTINHKVLAAGIVAYRKSKEALLVLYPHVTETLTILGKRGIK